MTPASPVAAGTTERCGQRLPRRRWAPCSSWTGGPPSGARWPARALPQRSPDVAAGNALADRGVHSHRPDSFELIDVERGVLCGQRSTGTTTTTTVRVVPNRAFQGIPVIRLANVAPRGAAGTVQFTDATTALGALVPVRGGQAFLITTTLTTGTHTISAVFTPTNPTALAPSTSSPVSLTVQPLFAGLRF
ncbi:MAG: Ig-like domain-containing protein [Pseudonocardiaceae bacterium]